MFMESVKMKQYKITIKEVFTFRNGESEERTMLERSTSDLHSEIPSWTEPATLADLLDDVGEWIDHGDQSHFT